MNLLKTIIEANFEELNLSRDVSSLAIADYDTLSDTDAAAYDTAALAVESRLSPLLEKEGLALEAFGREEIINAVLRAVDPQVEMSDANYTRSKESTQGNNPEKMNMVLENFDHSSTAQLALTAAFNIIQRNGGPMVRAINTMFPPIQLGNAGGIRIEIDIPEVIGNTSHGDGTVAPWEKVRLNNGLASNHSFATTWIFPCVETCDNALLVDPIAIVPNPRVVFEEELTTAPYLFGADIDYLGASQTPRGIAKGFYNQTDSIENDLAIDKIYVDFGADIVEFNMSGRTSSRYPRSILGAESDSTLILNEDVNVTDATTTIGGVPIADLTIPAGHTAILRIKASGDVSLRTGVGVVNFNDVKLVNLYDADSNVLPKSAAPVVTLLGELVDINENPNSGYTLKAKRVNANLRSLGPIIDSEIHSEEYWAGYGQPASVIRPVNRKLTDSSIAQLSTYVTQETVKEHIAKLEETSGILNGLTNGGTFDPVSTPSVLGAGRHMLHTAYVLEEIDIAELNSISHKDREQDIAGLVQGVLNKAVDNMWHRGNYEVAITARPDGLTLGKPTVCILTDNRTGTILNKYTKGRNSEYKWSISTLPSPKLDSTIYMVFNFEEGTTNKSFNRLNFGLSAERTAVVYNTVLTKENATYKTHTVQRVKVPFVNAPVMAVIDILNWNAAYDKVCCV